MCEKNLIGNINGYPLDQQQLEAATSDAKHSIIIAGAGSGKSTTMIGKVKYLTNVKNVNPKSILCISFTNEATTNLKNNIAKNCNIEVDVLTFHKLALKILKDNNVLYKLAPANYLEYIINEFFLCQENFIVINNTINFLKNKFYMKNWQEYLKIAQTSEFNDLKKLIVSFLTLYFAKYNSIEQLKKFYYDEKNKKNICFLKLIIAIYKIYQIEKQSQGYIDFNDMIYLATNIAKRNGFVGIYKHIIIDEFQDTSPIRFELIKALVNKNNASLTVVGDDFQSIYKFSGCNLNCFLNFSTNFKNAKTFKIENTYRNSQELIDVAGNFIMKNPNQHLKTLISSKRLNQPIKIIYEKKNSLLTLLKKISTKKVLILGRNNSDINKYLNNDLKINTDGFITYKNKKLNTQYLTVHKSKGLEADVVIIINLINDDYGFPIKLVNHKILKLVCDKDHYPYEEERRLFYVALTRSKNEVYLITEKNNSSIFVKELLKNYKESIEIIKNI